MAFLFQSDKNTDKQLAVARLEDTIEMLKDVHQRLLEIQERVDTIERVLAERLPPDVMTERKFKEEVQSGDDIAEKIIARVEELAKTNSIRDVIESRMEQKPSLVETRRIEVITGLLQQHGKLNSEDLAEHIGLSRTRCNEYFKEMEGMGIVEPVLIGKEKFYRLS